MGSKHINIFFSHLRSQKSFYTLTIIFLLSATLFFNSTAVAFSPEELQLTYLTSFPSQMCGSAFTSNGTLFAGDNDYNLYRSDDMGASFRLINTFPAQPHPVGDVAGYVWTVFVDSNDRIFISIPGTNRLYRSTNFGSTFTQVLNNNSTQNDGFYIGLTEDWAGNLYAATYSGNVPYPPVLKSTDGGASWTILRTFAAIHLHNVKFNPANGYLYVATGEWTFGVDNNECERVFRSKDFGETWSIIIDRTREDDDYGDTIYLPMLFDGNYVYFGTDQAFRSNWIDRIYDDGSDSFLPQKIYEFSDDGDFPVLSGAWVNDTMLFGTTAEFSGGTSRIVASQDGLNWYEVKSTEIVRSQHHTNMLTSNPLGVAFGSDGDETTFMIRYPSNEPVSTVFEDGFETGDFSLWAGTSGSLTHSETINTEHPITGSYSANFTVTTQDGAAYAYQNVAITQRLALNYTFNVNMMPPGEPSELSIGGFYSDEEVLVPVLRNSGGNVYWGLFDGSYHFETVPSNPSVYTDYHVTVVLDKQNSQGHLLVDNVEKVATSKVWTKPTYNFNVGINAAYMNVGTGLIEYVDDVTVDNSTQGLPIPTPTPTATPTPSPSPSPTPVPTPSGTIVYTLNMAMTATIGETPYIETNITRPIQSSWIASDGTLYAGDGRVLYKSLNQGVDWQSLLAFNGTSALACVYVNKYNHVFVAPETNAATDELGLWRSIDAGQTWKKELSLPKDCTIWGIDEDASGTLYAGVYTAGPNNGNARIYRSLNNGSSWVSIYYNANARHIHDVAVDKTNGYIYASVGDLISPWNIAYIIRSTTGGNNWQEILPGLPQIVAIEAVPGARLFGTDAPTNGEMYRTTTDSSFTRVLDTGSQSYAFWIRTNSLNGKVYASFVGGEADNRNAGIYTSSNNGLSWSLYRSFDIHAGYLGSEYASNFVSGIMYYSLQLDSGWQNGVKIHPQYGYGSSSLVHVEDLAKILPPQIIADQTSHNQAIDFPADTNDTVDHVGPDLLIVPKPFDSTVSYDATAVSDISRIMSVWSLPEKRKTDSDVFSEIQVTFPR